MTTDTAAVTSADTGLPYVPEEHYAGARRVQERYDEEKNKRLRSDGLDQYIEPAKEETLRYLAADPWTGSAKSAASISTVLPNSCCRALIVGAGPAGLATAALLVDKANFRPEEVCVVDAAGGVGGTWYWNRYPGLMCDVESYLYLPLLEETGYMPTHKYAYGTEIRHYCELLVQKYGFKTILQAQAQAMDWDETESCWITRIEQKRTGCETELVSIKSQFVSIASGTLAHPKVPRWPGINDFKGNMFHTSRWHYDVTGGSSENVQNPTMDRLKNKRVGFVGTGATAVQAVPALAKWAKELLVFQRTPSHVDVRGQCETTPEDWAKIANKPGWVNDRHHNFIASMINAPEDKPAEDLVDDGWSRCPSYGSTIGSPVRATEDNYTQFTQMFHALDYPRSERIRARVDEIVHDKVTAEKLKAYYASFCKRPCFHDDYLDAFNQPNVKLIDTDGKGVEALTEHGVVCQGVEYPVDVLILGTGFRSPGEQAHSRAGVSVTGRNGTTLADKFSNRLATLHGVFSRDFPNFIFSGPSQASASPSITYVFEMQSRHGVHIIKEAERRVGSPNFTIEPSQEAEDEYTQRCIDGVIQFGTGANCLPSYLNKEGSLGKLPEEELKRMMRGAIWGFGCNEWVAMLQEWRDRGDLHGMEVCKVSLPSEQMAPTTKATAPGLLPASEKAPVASSVDTASSGSTDEQAVKSKRQGWKRLSSFLPWRRSRATA